MAKAEAQYGTVQTGVLLYLSVEEAVTLRAVCAKVAGDNRRSRRKHTDAVAAALESAGVSYRRLGNGSVDMNDEKIKERG